MNTFMTRGRFHKLFCALTPNFCALRPTFEKLFTGAKAQPKAQKMGAGRETFYEIDPWRKKSPEEIFAEKAGIFWSQILQGEWTETNLACDKVNETNGIEGIVSWEQLK